FTRAGFSNDHRFKDAENQPQSPDSIAFNGEGLDNAVHRRYLAVHLTMLNESVLRTIHNDRVSLYRVAGLREGKRTILLCFPEARATLRQSAKKALIALIHSAAHILTDLRMQILPQGKT